MLSLLSRLSSIQTTTGTTGDNFIFNVANSNLPIMSLKKSPYLQYFGTQNIKKLSKLSWLSSTWKFHEVWMQW